jgi:hypothetical protein
MELFCDPRSQAATSSVYMFVRAGVAVWNSELGSYEPRSEVSLRDVELNTDYTNWKYEWNSYDIVLATDLPIPNILIPDDGVLVVP